MKKVASGIDPDLTTYKRQVAEPIREVYRELFVTAGLAGSLAN